MTDAEVLKAAKSEWDEDRAFMRKAWPEWPIPAWNRAPAWRKRPYILAARFGEKP